MNNHIRVTEAILYT